MSKNILFIFEGEKTEKQITDNLTKFFISENSVIQCAFCTDIYKLYKDICEEDYDTFLLLKEKNQNILSSYTRTDFAEIYLFFDYDGHAPTANDDKIKEVLTFFNEETDKGKLFLSYPMVEAIKHFSNEINFKELKVKAKENIRYKHIVSNEADSKLIDLTAYKKETWLKLIDANLKKMNYIVNGNFTLPKSIHSQEEVFKYQIEKYITIDETVAVLSSFPIFLFEYYGTKLLEE